MDQDILDLVDLINDIESEAQEQDDDDNDNFND